MTEYNNNNPFQQQPQGTNQQQSPQQPQPTTNNNPFQPQADLNNPTTQQNQPFKVGTEIDLNMIGEKLVKGTNVNANIIKVRDLQPGEIFTGLVYVRKSNYRRNKQNPELYDLYFQCVDGDGLVFRVAMFASEKKEVVKSEVMLIVKGMAVEQLSTGKTYYNVENIVKFTDFKVPISMFLREIEDINNYSQDLINIISELAKDADLYSVYQAVEDKYNYFNMLKTVHYKDTLGTRLGSTIKVIVDTCNTYKTVMNPKTEEQIREYRLFILTTLLAFLQQTLLNFTETNVSEEVYNNLVSEIISPINEELLTIIYQKPLRRIDRSKILSVLNNMSIYNRNENIQGKFPLEIVFFNILKMVESNLYIIEIIKSKDKDSKRHPSGIYLV